MAPKRTANGQGRRKVQQLTQYEGEKDEDYRLRRDRNNEAVRRSRDKSKKKTEETLKRVEDLKLQNCMLEADIRNYRKQLTDLKDIFLSHAASGKIDPKIDIEALLKETDPDAESPHSTS